MPDGSPRTIIDRPADAADYRWLEIVADKKFAPDSFRLSESGDPATSISFTTDSRSPRRYLVQVGACAHWWGYDTTTLVLDHARRQQIRSVRLIG